MVECVVLLSIILFERKIIIREKKNILLNVVLPTGRKKHRKFYIAENGSGKSLKNFSVSYFWSNVFCSLLSVLSPLSVNKKVLKWLKVVC